MATIEYGCPNCGWSKTVQEAEVVQLDDEMMKFNNCDDECDVDLQEV